jgi:hypothetical protein
MAYNRGIQQFNYYGLVESPRKVCPHTRVFGAKNCINCHFGGSMLLSEICSYLESLIVKERNNRKYDFLVNSADAQE